MTIGGRRRNILLKTRRINISTTAIIFASSFYALSPGDIIITSTPEGGPMVPGELMVASIEKIGTMEVKARAASHVSAIGHA